VHFPVNSLVSRRLLAAFAVMLLPFAGRAAINSDSNWLVRVWQSDDGLPNNIVTGLAQSRDGFLWVATPVRLARFDGVHFDEFASKAVARDHDERISVLLQSGSGQFWLVMDHGPVICAGSGRSELYTNNLPEASAQGILEDADGGIWVFYRGGMVCRIADGAVKRFGPQDAMPSGPCSLAQDTKGRLWFAKGGQLGVVRGNRFQTLKVVTGVASTARVASARTGGIWVAAGTKLYRYDEGRALQETGSFAPENPGAELTALMEDRSGAVWVGTSSSGLFRYADGRFEKVPTSHGEILSLLEDREGNLWVGTGGGGLDEVRPRVAELEAADAGLPLPTVQSICEDKQGGLWATTQNELLVCRTNGAWVTISNVADWPGVRVTCVAADQKGGVWIGTKDRGILYLSGGHFTVWRKANGLAGHIIHALMVSSKGDVWIGQGSPESLQCLRQGAFKDFQLPPNIGIIRAIAEDTKGDICLGTSKGALLRVRNDEVVNETPGTSSDPLSIRCLCATPDGALWIGYAGGGLGWLKDGHYRRMGMEQGLEDYYISQITDDGRGWLWFGADHGIFKVRLQELQALTEGRATRVKSVHYGKEEGLPNLQANFGDSPGTLKSRDGRLWLPMRTALAVVDPAKLCEDSQPPTVLLKRVAVDGQPVAVYADIRPARDALNLAKPAGELTLPPGHHRLDFEFTAPSFTAPENVQFRYHLDGVDDGWIEAGTQRSAGYSRLPAGNYRFRVSACNSAGVWAENAATLGFSVTPFIWQRWWFRLAVLSGFTLSVAIIARYVSVRRLRIKLRALEQQAALERERARIAKDIHDDLGGSLTQVELLLGMALEDRTVPGRMEECVRQVSSTVRQVGESLDEIVWAVNPRNDTLPDLIEFIGQFAVEFLHTAGLRCRVDLPDNPLPQQVSPEVRHNLFLVLKEALNNIARHAEASEVRLRIAINEEALNITLEDNGKGFEGTPSGTGADGLHNMQQRMSAIGGICRIESKPGFGTSITLILPWAAGGEKSNVRRMAE